MYLTFYFNPLQISISIEQYPKNLGFFFRLMRGQVIKSQKESMVDRVLQEEVVKESNLDWLLIKPPRLTDGDSSGKYVFGEEIKVGLLFENF
jgi:hypothetical protein